LNQVVERLPQRIGDRLRGVGQPWEIAAFFWIPMLVLAFTAWYELHNDKTLGDLPIFRAASTAVLHGHSPYVAPDPHALAGFDTFVYPPAAAYLFAPFALVPYSAAKVLIVVLGLASTMAALRLVGVRDWRCYGVAAVSAPVVNSLALGAFTSLLLLGAAATWHYRDRPQRCGIVASLTATAKLFLWPLGLWLLVTRRPRAAITFGVVTTALVLGGWAAIDFAGLRAYPHLLRLLSQLEAHKSFSVIALVKASGTTATAISALLAVSVVAAVVAASRAQDGERRAFAVAVLGALLATPVVWTHYYALLFVPIALYRPRLSAIWFAPLALWLAPATYSEGVWWKILIGLGLVGAVGATVVGLEVPRIRLRNSRLTRVHLG
jgi:alpha-1,2-mannosyltransferase